VKIQADFPARRSGKEFSRKERKARKEKPKI
jgi:hypothetical protein